MCRIKIYACFIHFGMHWIKAQINSTKCTNKCSYSWRIRNSFVQQIFHESWMLICHVVEIKLIVIDFKLKQPYSSIISGSLYLAQSARHELVNVLTYFSFLILLHMDVCSKFYLLCYAALLKNFTYYAQIMLIDMEQFPDICSSIPMFCR